MVLEARSRGTALATASFAAAERAPAVEERREEGRGVWKPAVGFVMAECFGIGRDSTLATERLILTGAVWGIIYRWLPL